jgi:hypothetical protein
LEYRVFPQKTAITQDSLQKRSKWVESLKISGKMGVFGFCQGLFLIRWLQVRILPGVLVSPFQERVCGDTGNGHFRRANRISQNFANQHPQ